MYKKSSDGTISRHVALCYIRTQPHQSKYHQLIIISDKITQLTLTNCEKSTEIYQNRHKERNLPVVIRVRKPLIVTCFNDIVIKRVTKWRQSGGREHL
ncbi:hypothetical protein DV965_17885, partial [Staphylococcus pseudintermedius]